MGRKTENSSFNCISCGKYVDAIKKGTIRNHCPFCLRSVHVDNVPGDRANDCHGLMRPIAITSHSAKGWQILHKCEKCGYEGKNRLADDDDMDKITEIMRDAGLGK
ncbi:MAG: RNHCP domain-containing protein [Defluviitaleaceae bacterium]|nr:RNHCP domain-containing protein [Defluviitaleaceae bacterium]